MTRQEIDELRRKSFLALKAFFAISLDADSVELLELNQMAAARSMHEAACRELLTCPDPVPIVRDLDMLRLAVTELDKALSDTAMPKEHVRLALRILLQVLRAPGGDQDIAEASAEGGFPP